jgi:pimeloyl-ACP methyl ester carboxylesterase
MAAVFTPHGEVARTMACWKVIGERFRWIIYASKQYSNQSAQAATDFNQYADGIAAAVESALTALPADRTRVVLGGFSGGGFFAEYLNSRHPNLGAALVVAANGLYAHSNDPEIPIPNQADTSSAARMSASTPPTELPFPTSAETTSRRIAAFLYSPTDREYGRATRLDRAFYKRNGWSTSLLRYPGGHVDPPEDTCLRAAAWIVARHAWYSSQ